jgi:flavin reductase (DIM6/NTAB) family NADH-FMN oxidoreductase RutF
MSVSAAADLFRTLDREIWLVTSGRGEHRSGLIATSVTQASIATEAPRVIVGLARQHFTWEVVEQHRGFVLHLLPADRFDLVQHFGMQSGRDVDKFSAPEYSDDLGGGPRLNPAPGWLDCRVEASWDAGDRSFYLAEVIAAQAPSPEARLLTTRGVFSQAPAEWLPILRSQYEAAARRDVELSRRWRETQSRPGCA